MSQASQIFNQIIDNLEKSIVNSKPIPFSTYFESLTVPKALMQKLIAAHDLQITAAIDRASKQK
jgi:uncharacterized protein YqgV (UPF0045/DUF77 family)